MKPYMSKEYLTQYFEKYLKYRVKSYNRYQWWRRYSHKKTVPESYPLENRIAHGDFEVSDYLHQAEMELYELESKEAIAKNVEQLHDFRRLYHERHRRLQEDFQKEERELLKSLVSSLAKKFNISKEYVVQKMESFDGTTMDLFNELALERESRIKGKLL